MTNSLGWSVLRQVEVRRERWPGGEWRSALPLVTPGQDILPDQPVMRLLRKKPVPPTNSYAGQGLNEAAGGEIATIPAGLCGNVVDITGRGGVIIESRVAAVPGLLGAGRQVAGPLIFWPGEHVSRHVIPPGAILIVPGPINLALLSHALVSEVQGVVAGSITLPDLEGFLHADMLQLLTKPNVEQAQEHLPPLTLLLTEGIGQHPMPEHTLSLLQRYEGSLALLSGATSIRADTWPELLISLSEEDARPWHPDEPMYALIPGAVVRVCSGEYDGAIGVVDALLTYEWTFPSGVRARAARLSLDDSKRIVVPVALIERIG